MTDDEPRSDARKAARTSPGLYRSWDLEAVTASDSSDSKQVRFETSLDGWRRDLNLFDTCSDSCHSDREPNGRRGDLAVWDDDDDGRSHDPAETDEAMSERDRDHAEMNAATTGRGRDSRRYRCRFVRER